MLSRDHRAAERRLFSPALRRTWTQLLGVLALALAACTPGPASPRPAAENFDAARAWRDLEKLVGLGPRQSGTPSAEATRLYLEEQLSAAGLKPLRESFTEDTPIGPIAFANLYAEVPAKSAGSDKPWILLCAHYDTKRMSFPFVGANDAGSGTVVLLELARAVAKRPSEDFSYRFLFLDGEESINTVWVDPDNRYGSRYHAKRLRETGRADKFKACILLDMVGDKDLHVLQEGYSDARLYEVIAKSAAQLQLSAHFANSRGQPVLDDHLPFMAVNIRSVDLIDFEYGPNNSWWHTKDDVLANCSQQSLEIIGRVVLNALPALEAHLKR
jgi:hypothetical protein